MTTLFVTGGAGFIGSNFIRYWLSTYPDDRIVNYDLLTYAGNLASLQDVEKNYGDRYTFVRDAYLQRRQFLVNDGVVEDTFGDEDYEEDWDDEEWLEE